MLEERVAEIGFLRHEPCREGGCCRLEFKKRRCCEIFWGRYATQREQARSPQGVQLFDGYGFHGDLLEGMKRCECRFIGGGTGDQSPLSLNRRPVLLTGAAEFVGIR